MCKKEGQNKKHWLMKIMLEKESTGKSVSRSQ